MAKVRVYELAKELGVESKVVLTTLGDMGEFVRSASSTVEAPVVRRLREKLTSEPPPAPKTAKAPAAAPAAAAPTATAPAATAPAAAPVAAAPARPRPQRPPRRSRRPRPPVRAWWSPHPPRWSSPRRPRRPPPRLPRHGPRLRLRPPAVHNQRSVRRAPGRRFPGRPARLRLRPPEPVLSRPPAPLTVLPATGKRPPRLGRAPVRPVACPAPALPATVAPAHRVRATTRSRTPRAWAVRLRRVRLRAAIPPVRADRGRRPAAARRRPVVVRACRACLGPTRP